MDKRVLTLNFKDTLSALSDLMMPRVCIVCGRELTLREKLLCLPCSLDLPLTRFESWEHNPMADKYNERIGSSNAPFVNQIPERDYFVHKKPFWCTKCSPETVSYTRGASGVPNLEDLYEPYQRATALLHYWHDSGYANIPQALKYGRNIEAGRYFGAMLGKRLRNSPLFADIDLVVPVPLHWMRHLRRGYNQAEILARAIARELSVPAAPRLLRRIRRTRTQTRKSLEEKSLNVSGAFEVRRNRIPPAHHILLVDDVFTTGSTLTECHNALRKVFGPDVRISLATLSYAG